jgi:hypothetical protein
VKRERERERERERGREAGREGSRETEASTDLIGAANKTEAKSNKKVHVVGVRSKEVRLRRTREVF